MEQENLKQELAQKEQQSQELHAKSLAWSNFERPYKLIRFLINGFLMIGAIYCWVTFIWYEVFGTHPEWAPWALPLAIVATVLFVAEKIFYAWFKSHILDMQDQVDRLDKEIEDLRRRM